MLAVFRALPIDDDDDPGPDLGDRDLWNGIARETLPSILNRDAPHEERLNEAEIWALANLIGQIVEQRCIAFLKEFEAMIDAAKAIPEVREAFDAGDKRKAWALAEEHGVDTITHGATLARYLAMELPSA